MTIKEIRTLTGLSQQKFGDFYHIPRRTIQDWEADRMTPPSYVIELLERAVKEDFEKSDKGEDSMTFEEKVLRNDVKNTYSDFDVKRHLEDGVFVYSSYEEYKRDCIAGLVDEEDIPEMWERLDKSIVDGTEYRYDVVL